MKKRYLAIAGLLVLAVAAAGLSLIHIWMVAYKRKELCPGIPCRRQDSFKIR